MGMALGGTQSIGRALYTCMIPAGQEAEVSAFVFFRAEMGHNMPLELLRIHFSVSVSVKCADRPTPWYLCLSAAAVLAVVRALGVLRSGVRMERHVDFRYR